MKRHASTRTLRLFPLGAAFVLLLVPASVTSTGISPRQACASGDGEATCIEEINTTCLLNGEFRQHFRPSA